MNLIAGVPRRAVIKDIGRAAQTDRVFVVTSLEPTAIEDVYAAIELLMTAEPRRDIGAMVSAVRDADQEEFMLRQASTAATRPLCVTLRDHVFAIRDATVGEAVVERRPAVSCTPDPPASRCVRRRALRVASWSRRPPSPHSTMAALAIPFSLEDFARLEAPRCA